MTMEISNEDIQRKLRRGRAWLTVHGKHYVDLLGWRYEVERWQNNLAVYNAYLAEAKGRGITEMQALAFEHEMLTADVMTLEKVYLCFI